MNIIVSFEGVSDVSVVLLQNAYTMTSPFADASCCMTFCYASLQIKLPTSTVCCSDGVHNDRRQSLVTYHFFNTLLQSILFCSMSRLILLNVLCWLLNSHSVYWMWNSSCYLSPGGATLYNKFDEFFNRYVQQEMA